MEDFVGIGRKHLIPLRVLVRDHLKHCCEFSQCSLSRGHEGTPESTEPQRPNRWIHSGRARGCSCPSASFFIVSEDCNAPSLRSNGVLFGFPQRIAALMMLTRSARVPGSTETRSKPKSRYTFS